MAADILQFPILPMGRMESEVRDDKPPVSVADRSLRRALGILVMVTDSCDGIEDSATVEALYAAQALLREAQTLLRSRST